MKLLKAIAGAAFYVASINSAHATIVASYFDGWTQFGGQIDNGAAIVVPKVGAANTLYGFQLTTWSFVNVAITQVDGPLDLDCGCWTYELRDTVDLMFAGGGSYQAIKTSARSMIYGGTANAVYQLNLFGMEFADFSRPDIMQEFLGDGSAEFTITHNWDFVAYPGVNVARIDAVVSAPSNNLVLVYDMTPPPPPAPAVPEPATWATVLLGFGVIGFGMRRSAARRDSCLSVA